MVDVIRSFRIHRLGFLLAYALTTILAQAGNLHGHHVSTETHCQTVCDDTHPHLSGHPSPDLGHAVSECPACQLRWLPHLIDLSGPSPFRIQVATATFAEPRTIPVLATLRPSCRAPPLS